MPQSYFPLRWESTGDQWWYASPIDWAAANGHYDLVRELLHLDTNLLIKLTSLRRIRRLETVWDDDSRFKDVAKCRSVVARSLLHECEMKNRKNSLIRAGYGGWLLYTAASAGDTSFVQELLERDPLLVFGEGEYGVTDIFYAAARSKNPEVFRALLDFAVSPRCSVGGGRDLLEESAGAGSVFRQEMVNRAVHAAARGGNFEILKELLADCSDVLAYRDLHGCTILHAASGRGQVEVVKHLIASFDIINSRDTQGNTSLHVAAFRGHLLVVEALVMASPMSSTWINYNGDTFLHMAVAGFRTPGFRRLDRQMELMRQVMNGNVINIQEVINIRNNDGRTALHMAVAGNVHSDLVELLMTVQSINLNIRDAEGMTPLDILRQHPRSPSSEILIKQIISAGGIANSKDYRARSATSFQLKAQGIGNSPGTSFRISDAEIFLCTGIGMPETSGRPSSCSSASNCENDNINSVNEKHLSSHKKKRNPVDNAARHLKKILRRWPRHKDKKSKIPRKLNDDDSFDSISKWCDREETPTPLRQRFAKGMSLPNNKRTLSVRSSAPSPSSRKKSAASIIRGVIQAMPHLARASKTTSNSLRSSVSSEKKKGIYLESENSVTSCSNSSVNSMTLDNASHKSGTTNGRVVNHYSCFGAHGLAVDDPASGQKCNRLFKRAALSVT